MRCNARSVIFSTHHRRAVSEQLEHSLAKRTPLALVAKRSFYTGNSSAAYTAMLVHILDIQKSFTVSPQRLLQALGGAAGNGKE
jgi:hypothetical protein